MKNLKEWQKVLLGIIAVLVILLAVDRVIGGINETIYYNSKYGIFRRQIYCLNESRDDVLILGSSRASHQYVPSVFTDSLEMSCYNCGSEGMCIYYHYVILASYIERRVKPKMVIYDVMDLDAQEYFGPTFGIDAALDRLAPHYEEYKCIDSLFLLKDWKEQVKLQSKCYRFNSKLVQSIKCNFIPSLEDHGYEVVKGNLSNTAQFKICEYQNSPIDSTKLFYVKKLIWLAKNNDIPLLLVQSPKYSKNECSGIDIIKKIAKDNGIEFWDYMNELSLMKKENFRDESHLNDDGARLWSKFLAHKIKIKLLKK